MTSGYMDVIVRGKVERRRVDHVEYVRLASGRVCPARTFPVLGNGEMACHTMDGQTFIVQITPGLMRQDLPEYDGEPCCYTYASLDSGEVE